MTHENIIFASYGNDSIALIQWCVENNVKDIGVIYSDTGWASDEWGDRVIKAEKWCESLGVKTYRTECEGFENLMRRKKGFPQCQRMQFCTEVLKIIPGDIKLDEIDPEKDADCITGIRRCESVKRATAPEHVEVSDNHGGRSLWSPLVRHTDEMRNELIERTPFNILPHKSRECFPCVCSNRKDLLEVDEKKIKKLETLENELGFTKKGKPRVMFRPYRQMGATGIREAIKWAQSPRGKYDPRQVDMYSYLDCSSGFCGN